MASVASSSPHAIFFTEADTNCSHPVPSSSGLRKAPGRGVAEPSVVLKCTPSRSLVLSRARIFCSQSSKPLGEAQQDHKADMPFKNLPSPVDAAQGRSRGSSDRRDATTRSFSSLLTALQAAKNSSSEHQRGHLYSEPSTSVQQPVHRIVHSEGQRSSDAETNSPLTGSVQAGERWRPRNKGGNRKSSRSFDILDGFMSSQGSRSKALLESLQSEVSLANNEINNSQRESDKDGLAGPFPRRFLDRNVVPQAQGEMERIMRSLPGRPQPVQADFNDTSGTAVVAGAFASSLEKALSPATGANPPAASLSNTDFMKKGTQALNSKDRTVGQQPGLKGQEVLWALQKAALEKARKKQNQRKLKDSLGRGRERPSLRDASEWQNAKPIVLKPEWALQIAELEQRIQALKNST